MSKKKKSASDAEMEMDVILSKSEQFIEKYSKQITLGVIALIVVVGLLLGYHHGIVIPNEKKAQVVLFTGEQYLAVDSFNLALNGDGASFEGFKSIVDEYGSTPSGNLAKAYAGICSFKLGNNDQAIKYLKSFDSKDDVVSPTITGLIGDCFVNAGDTDKAISYFKEAASDADNSIVSAVYLKKAGIAYESLKQYDKACEVYKQIKENYATSVEASDIDKYITRAQALNK